MTYGAGIKVLAASAGRLLGYVKILVAQLTLNYKACDSPSELCHMDMGI